MALIFSSLFNFRAYLIVADISSWEIEGYALNTSSKVFPASNYSKIIEIIILIPYILGFPWYISGSISILSSSFIIGWC